MKIKCIRIVALCMILTFLCIGAVLQYIKADKIPQANAILVMAQLNQ